MRLLLLLFTSFLFLAAACTKADDDTPTTPLDELPPATQVGANTFGCLIDGVPFQNRGGGNFIQNISGSYVPLPDNRFTCIAYDYENLLATRLINVVFKVDNVAIGVNKPRFDKPVAIKHTDNAETNYYTDSTAYYRYEVTYFDSELNIASGLIEATAVSSDKRDTIRITDGRFDVIYFE